MTAVLRRRGIVLLIASALILSTAGCAQEADTAWKPPAAAAAEGVTLLPDGQGTDGTKAGGANPEAAGQVAPGSTAHASASMNPSQLGLVGGRLRNDSLHLQARYALLPGVPKFNERVNELLWGAIKATGKPYAPQAFPAGAGLGGRDCIAGSTELNAADLLLRPETGPFGGTGTTITCSLIGAFGPYVGVRFRTVTGEATPAKPGAAGPTAKISSDRTVSLYANVRTGEVTDDASRWQDSAPAALWRDAVSLLRDRLGSLSLAGIADPDRAQLDLAAKALRSAAPAADGGFTVSLPAGLVAPELRALGSAATSVDTVVRVPAQVATEWAAQSVKDRIAAENQPFEGFKEAPWQTPVDCALVPCVALTYDDGPSAHTGQLLDTLRDKRAVATFFMLGNAAKGAPDLVRRAAKEGNEIGSHTMTHPDLTTISPANAAAQVKNAGAALSEISGQPVNIYRPPYGAINGPALEAIGWPAILWSIDTNDWRNPGPDALLDRCVTPVAPGGIILFHDTHPDSVTTAGRVIDGLRDRGFTPVTVSQLFGGNIPFGRVTGR
ncbi:polysaccharide deacetylase family protein [Leucobacter sp. CSA2]|uniref:Polysaccharide deacetylase family protein n=1 Tax=Leucobacter edaphi TaxID=2796472 RepID=A0A934QCQ0_9MICO|nr:polysaccharide deacetylase family protein [Leucobacter edaphi]MBK0422204.1 polysaccharide deacetylase family protein [Leucobacter edaphi]